MSRTLFHCIAWAAIWPFLLAPVISPATGEETGIFADFSTSLGPFTCQLEYRLAPKAVANFIGLATGQGAWLDPATAHIRTNAFFNGLTFHRVIAGFMIQSGSPNGLGTDGPGYVFPDEFDPSLRHDRPGVLSMANSGPRSNGSQFFVTVAPTPWLDDLHTIFGHVTSGQSVVEAINQVATDENNRPLTNVAIQNISIRRLGPEAEAFDIASQELPVVSPARLAITGGPNEVTLLYSNNLFTAYNLVQSTNLEFWAVTSLGIALAPPLSNSIPIVRDNPIKFFTLSQVQYPASTFAPKVLHQRTLTIQFDGGLGTLAILFDALGGGTYTYDQSPGTVSSYRWSQEPYRGFLWPIYFSDLVPMTLRLDFNSNTGGLVSGTAYPSLSPPFDVSGSFVLSGPESL